MTIQLGIAVALAVSTGAVAWVGGRVISRHTGDPLFVERLFAHRVAMIRIYSFVIVAIALLAPPSIPWLIPLTFFAIAIGGFPTRRRLYGETWSLPMYLAGRIRLVAGAGAPLIMLMAAPYLVQLAGNRWVFVIFILVEATLVFQQPLLLFGVRAEPLRDDALMRLLDPILDRAEAPRPSVFSGGAATGRFANAFALPSGKHSAIVLTRALLRELGPAEVAAIFAHEAAHLEQYAKRGMRVRVWIGRILIPLIAVGGESVAISNAPDAARWIPIIWSAVLLFALAGTLARRKKRETAADLRALQLGADPHALISGMEKLHRLIATPRRFDATREARMTHPSLARRIQAIRKAAGIEPPPSPQLPQVIVAENKRLVRFTGEGLEIFDRQPDEGAQPIRAYAYGAIQSLIVRKTLRGWELAGRSGGERIRIPVSAESGATAQAVLDSVDVRFAQPVVQLHASRTARLTAVLVLMLSLVPGISFAPIVAAILTLFSGGAPALAALGATAIAAGLGALTRPPLAYLENVLPAIAVAEILLGLLCLTAIRKFPDDERQRHLRATEVTLGITAAIVLLPVLITASFAQPLIGLYLAARARPSAAILLIGIAAALFTSGKRRMSIGPAGVAVGLMIAGMPTIGVLTGGDPLFTRNGPRWVTAPDAALVRSIDPAASRLRLAPDAGAFAVALDADEDEAATTFALGRASSELKEIPASDIWFAAPDRVLRVAANHGRFELDSVDLDGTPGPWKLTLPPMWEPSVTSGRNGEWVITGWRGPQYERVRLRGAVGDAAYEAEAIAGSALPAITPPAYGEKGIVYASIAGTTRSARPSWISMLGGGGVGTEFWRANGSTQQPIGRSVLRAAGTVFLPDLDEYVIAGQDDAATFVATVVDGGRIRPRGMISGTAFRIASARGSRIALQTPVAAVIWDIGTNKAMRVTCRHCMIYDVALADRAVGILTRGARGTALALYSTDALR